MAKEIERKFLVSDRSILSQLTGVRYSQGYISSDPSRVVRVRISGDSAYLTLKGPSKGAVRPEFEYAIPVGDAAELMSMCTGLIIEKKRYTLDYNGMIWEVDEFSGDNEGLCVAEIELDSEDQAFSLPPWAGREVTDDPRYYNVNLAKTPFRMWKES